MTYRAVELLSGRTLVGKRIRWRDRDGEHVGVLAETRRCGDGPIEAVVATARHGLVPIAFAPKQRAKRGAK